MAKQNGGISADLLAMIYDSAVDQAAWELLPALLAREVGAQTGTVFHGRDRAVEDMATHNCGESGPDYLNYYHTRDPWLAISLGQPRLSSMLGGEIIRDSQFAETEFYRDYARHWGFFHLLGVHAPLAPRLCFSIGLHRPRDSRPFDDNSKAHFNALLPHVQRALQLRLRLRRAEAHTALGFSALSALGFAAIVCNAQGVVAFANAAAEELARIEGGLKLDARNGITFPGPAKTQKLRALIYDAATGGPGGAVRVDCAGEMLLVLVTPLPGQFDDNASFGGRALIAIGRAADAPDFEQRMISDLFRLTPAEAELALSLLTPKSVEQIAAERNVKMPTLRTQLRNIFAKTGTESQRDLVRLLGSIPQIRQAKAL